VYGELTTKLTNPTKQDILTKYADDLDIAARYTSQQRRTMKELLFKEANWRLELQEGSLIPNLEIKLDQYSVTVQTYLRDLPDHIDNMLDEIHGTSIDYNIQLVPNPSLV